MSDAAGLCWITFSAWMLLRYCRALRRRLLLLAAFGLGWAVLTRWVYALAVVPWGLAAVLAWRSARLPLRAAFIAAGLAAMAGAAVVGSQFVFALGQSGPSHVGDLAVVGWNPAHAFLSTVSNSDGVFCYEYPIGVFYALPLVHPAFVFPMFTPFLLCGLWQLRRAPRSAAALLLGWPLVVYVFLAGIAWQNPRFSLALFPPLLVLVGLGLEAAWNVRRERWWRVALAVWCAAGLAGSLLWSVRDVSGFVARKQADLAAARWAEAQAPPGATLIAFGLTETLRHYTSLSVVELYNETPEGLRALTCGESPSYVFVDVANIESQWAGKSPEINLRWLKEVAGLRELGRAGQFTLFEVGRSCHTLPPPPSPLHA